MVYLYNVRDPDPASILERRGVGGHLEQHGLGPGPAGAGAPASLLFGPLPLLRIRRPPPHVEHDGACRTITYQH